MALNKDEILGEIIVSTGVAVLTTVTLAVPAFVIYKINEWWTNREIQNKAQVMFGKAIKDRYTEVE